MSVLVVVVPGVLGVFWGAPLVAGELESGSFRLAWTQDVSRIRWLALRLAVSGLAAMAVVGLASWVVTWRAGPLDRAGLDQFGSFDSRDIVPVGYAAFAVTLGVLLGTLLRRTVPAMAATLLTFTPARLAFRLLARLWLFPPVTRALALNPATTGYGSSGFLPLAPPPALQPAAPDLPNAWVTSIAIVNGNGKGLTASELARTCPGIGDRAAGGPGTGRFRSHAGTTGRGDRDASVRLTHRSHVPRGGDIPAGEPVLAVAMVRAVRLPRGRPAAGRSMRVAGRQDRVRDLWQNT